jgi:hypothetical protein
MNAQLLVGRLPAFCSHDEDIKGTGYSIQGAVKKVLIVVAGKNYKKRAPTKSIASMISLQIARDKSQ